MNSALMTPLDTLPKSALSKSTKPRMLVVDDEPDNLDLLYRTFRREFQILRAASGKEALEILAQEGEVAVIISDQRMPEMKGTEFLSKTVPQFPDTVRIILTGFTDVEDLVEAINAGQVYRYITKPWDPDELKLVVQRAAETYELLKQRTDEMLQAQTQALLLSRISEITESIDQFEAALPPIAEAFATAFGADGCLLQAVATGTLTGKAGIFGGWPEGDWLSQASLTADVLAKKQLHLVTNPADLGQPEIGSLVLVPALYREQAIAVLALQWQGTLHLTEGQQEALTLAIRHLALALVCLQR